MKVNKKIKKILLATLGMAFIGLNSNKLYATVVKQTVKEVNRYRSTSIIYEAVNPTTGKTGNTEKLLYGTPYLGYYVYYATPGETIADGAEYVQYGEYSNPKIAYMMYVGGTENLYTQAAIWKVLGYTVTGLNGTSLDEVDALIARADARLEDDGAWYEYKAPIFYNTEKITYTYDKNTNTYYSQYFTLKNIYEATINGNGYFELPNGNSAGSTVTSNGTYRIVYKPSSYTDETITANMSFSGNKYHTIIYKCDDSATLFSAEMSQALGGYTQTYSTILAYTSFAEYTPDYVGDMNEDGVLDVENDVTNLADYVLEGTYVETNLPKVDYNGDSYSTIEDAQELYLDITPNAILGDLNSDGTLSQEDLTIMQAFVDGTETLETLDYVLADLDQNEQIDDQDIETLQNLINSKAGGDINLDGYVNSTDAALVLDCYKNSNATTLNLYIADMNEDDILNSTDAAMILDVFKNS